MTDTTTTAAEVDLSGLRIPRVLQHDAAQILALTTFIHPLGSGPTMSS